MEELEKSLLRKIFICCIQGSGQLDAIEFRAENYQDLEAIDSLEKVGYILREDDKYHLHVIGLAEIAGEVVEAKNILDDSEKLFHELHKHYRKRPKENISLDSLSKCTNLPKLSVINSLSIMVQTHVFGNYSINLHDEDASVRPNESILKYQSFQQIVKQHQEWRLESTASAYKNTGFFSVKQLNQETFSSLLHPEVSQHSLGHYINGHLREAVLNSVIVVFDLIRTRTKLREDGDRLVSKALSLGDPYLVLSEIETESGQNDQKGFMQILKGVYQGIRNPKAHSLNHDLTEEKAAQYLVLSSLLARRIEEADLVKEWQPEKVV